MQEKNYVEPILKTVKLHALLTLLALYHHLRANISDPEILLQSKRKCSLDCLRAGKKKDSFYFICLSTDHSIIRFLWGLKHLKRWISGSHWQLKGLEVILLRRNICLMSKISWF